MVGRYIFDSTGLYLSIEFSFPCGWLEILLYIVIDVFLFALYVDLMQINTYIDKMVRLAFSNSSVYDSETSSRVKYLRS